MADKICPILMAGTMISNIYASRAKGTHLYYESVRCMGGKCEWFENGCPAHPHQSRKDYLAKELEILG